MFIALYPAELVATFSVAQPERAPFSSLAELESARYQLVVLNQSAAHEALTRTIEGQHDFILPISIETVQFDTWPNLHVRRQAIYIATSKEPACGFRRVPMTDAGLYPLQLDSLFTLPYGVDEAIVRAFNRIILRFLDQGVMGALVKRESIKASGGATCGARRPRRREANAMSMWQLQSPFRLWLVALCIGVFVFVGERCVRR